MPEARRICKVDALSKLRGECANNLLFHTQALPTLQSLRVGAVYFEGWCLIEKSSGLNFYVQLSWYERM